MIPDLGTYAFEVALAYAGSFVILVAIIGLSVLQALRSKRLLDETERRTFDA